MRRVASYIIMPTQKQSEDFALDIEESNFANSFSEKEMGQLQISVAEFYRTLFAVDGRNRARRQEQLLTNLGLGGSQ